MHICVSTLQFTGDTQCTIMGKTLSKGKEQQPHKRTQVSQLAAIPKSEESSDQGISEGSALWHGAFSSALPPQVKKLTPTQRTHWNLWDPLPTMGLRQPPSQPRLRRGQTPLSTEMQWGHIRTLPQHDSATVSAIAKILEKHSAHQQYFLRS